MSRDCRLSRRNSGKNLKFEETENLPVNANLREHSIGRVSIDSHSRPPLNAIQEPPSNPSKSDYELGLKSSKIYRTPTKPKVRNPESGMPLRTPDKQGGLGRNRYGWGQESRDEGRFGNVHTPKPCRTLSRGSLGFPEVNSTHSTPTKSVGKPASLGLVCGGSSRPPVNGGFRTGNFTALSKGIPVAFNACTTVNTVEVPHFELREDPSFWMDHNVQVLIRIRPLNGMEISSQGYSRCLKQESAQSLTWVAQTETRFTFDHVACETIDQETLFKMVGQPMVENCLSGYNSCMFAYGQTGSGKTHTMLGEMNDLEIKPSPNRGMTPRIFEFLFARIIAEEESRKDERLKYSCKCSFLEIYNEQITDLLDPSSTNLQLREDVKKGVYVENLTEYEVHRVGDVLKLLSQGSANRRVAATNMNRESSRSHSVFTCVIESRWEKDSTSNLRFARLNLVDLAGSERQKTSGAEGERLKEAANINKSLSTLGHVIMVLVDGANSRTRHVPYRDSRLTFLLQDSLGGNSKTMIIANVSPSISSATETLNTLKFAQRAKLIQNNAVINEDASGDVAALQHQIRLLKEELAILKRQNTSRSLTFSSKDENCSNASSTEDDDKILRISSNQLKSLESSLNGALRREKSTENCIKQLEAEIEQLNCLVRQREEENRCTTMMLKFREDKIQKMESVFSGLISADSFLIEENNTLTEEIKLLRAKVERNPEVTRFAVENIRLLEQLKRFQDFYEEGEREMLLAEVSELRDQLALFFDESNHMNLSTEKEAAEDKKVIDALQSELIKSQEELEKCRNNLNSCLEKKTKLCREISDLNALLEVQKSSLNDQDAGSEVIKESIMESSLIEDQSSHTAQEKDEIFKKYPEEITGFQLELDFLKIILEEERLIQRETEEKLILVTKAYEKSILKEKETQQELTLLKEMCEEKDEIFSKYTEELVGLQLESDFLKIILEEERLIHREKEEKFLLITKAYDKSILKEKETQQELTLLREKCEEKDRNFNGLSEEFDILTKQIEEVLTVGHNALDDASNFIGHGKQIRVCENLQIIARKICEKELRIDELNTCLEDAKTRGNDMESMLRSLRGAILVMSEAHQKDCIKKDEEIDKLLSELNEKNSTIIQMEEQRKLYEIELIDAMKNTTQQALESCCHLHKFEETKQKIKETDFMINNLVNENEALKIEINELKRNENIFINESEILKNSCSVLEKQLKNDAMGMKRIVQTINEKDEELRCLEEKLVMELSAKDIELFMMSSKLEQVASENNDLEKDKISMSEVLEKFKEEIIISYVDLHFDNFILLEKDIQPCHLQKEVEMQDKDLKFQQELENKRAELSLHKEENEKLVMITKSQKDEIEEFEACFESLEFKHYENIVKSLVLEVQLTENVKDALKAKRSAEEQLAETKKAMEIIEFKTAFGGNRLIESLKGDLESVTGERDDLHVEFVKAKQLYEVELTDAKVRIQEADSMINKLVTENEAMEIEISHQNQVNNAKEIELYVILSGLEQVASDHNDLKKEKINIYSVFEKLKEEIIISYADLHFNKDLILLEKDAEVGALQLRYEAELTDAKVKVQEADSMINTLVTENKAMEIESSHQNQVINAKEIELYIILSGLEQAALDTNDLEKEKFSIYSVFEKFKEEIVMSHVDLHLKDLILLEKDAEVGALQMACETGKNYDEEKLKLYEKSVEELESTVNLLENQVDLVKGDAESQRLKKVELEQEVQKIHQQKQLLVTENETFKTENADYKIKVIELEDQVKKLSGQQDLQQRLHQLTKIKEENNVLKAQNDEISHKLRKAEAIVTRVKEEVANLRSSNRRNPL